MNAMRAYFHELVAQIGSSWSAFWFTPRDPSTACALRIAVGLLAAYFVVSHTADLQTWFGPDGILDSSTIAQLDDTAPAQNAYRLSYLHWAATATSLWALHGVGLAIIACVVVGLWTRVTSVGALVVVLAYVHRGPLLTGPFEPVLSMLLAYLCLAPAGSYWSLDAWRAGYPTVSPSWTANVAIRLIQVHLAGFSLLVGLNMLAAETWWAGEAMWWLVARSETRWVDLSAWIPSMLVINGWTHATVAYLLLFGVLIWNRLARPLLLVLGVPVWGGLALASGSIAWCLAMCVASLAFVDSSRLDSSRLRRSTE
jgi:hypothetical protein